MSSSGPSHVSIRVGNSEKGYLENVADVGFGFSQIIPVVAQLHAVMQRRMNSESFTAIDAIYAVEQPELHLHPAMQGRLADLFVAATSQPAEDGYSVKVIVETHSESLISRLGSLISQGVVEPSRVSIIFVEKDNETQSCSLRPMAFDDDGLIAEWPIGFFSN